MAGAFGTGYVLEPHRLKSVLPRAEMGRAAAGGDGRSWGMGKFKKSRTVSTVMQAMAITGVIVCGLYLKPANLMISSNHAIILPFDPAGGNGTRVTFASVLLYSTFGFHTPRSGMIQRASFKRFVKFAMQMASVSSTICPSS